MSLDGFFIQEQQLSLLKDKAIFSDTEHQRKRAIMELARLCGDVGTASAIISEIVDPCPEVGHADFKQFCRAIMSKIQENEICQQPG
jgi:hypothetical protein